MSAISAESSNVGRENDGVSDCGSPARRFVEAIDYPFHDLPPARGFFSRPIFLSRFRRKFGRWLGNLVFEHGLDTSREAVELDHFHRDRVRYAPSGWLDLRRALRKREVRATDVFVDFGSGKGRVVYQAARYPLARVVGVEISDKLNQIARANIERKRDKLACQEVELVTVDAADFQIPDDMTIAYFFFPFSGDTFETVIDNIVRSISLHPRRVKLIYQWPMQEDYILGTGRFKLVRTLKHRRRHPGRVSVYLSESAS